MASAEPSPSGQQHEYQQPPSSASSLGASSPAHIFSGGLEHEAGSFGRRFAVGDDGPLTRDRTQPVLGRDALSEVEMAGGLLSFAVRPIRRWYTALSRCTRLTALWCCREFVPGGQRIS